MVSSRKEEAREGDIVVNKLVPLCIVRAEPIGVITMKDEKGVDDKLIAVLADDPEYSHYRDVKDLAPHRMRELKQFLVDYKVLENKQVDVDQMGSRDEAVRVLREAIELYQQKIAPTFGG